MQVKKLVQKVVTRDSVMYRKLTDKPVTESDKPSNESDKPSNQGDKPIKEDEGEDKEEEKPDVIAKEEVKEEKVEEPDEYTLARGRLLFVPFGVVGIRICCDL